VEGSKMNNDILEKRLKHSQKKVEILETMMEEKTRELFLANEQLQQANEYLHEIEDSMLDTLIVLNPDCTIRSVNRAALEIFGYSEDELVGRRIGMLYQEEMYKRSRVEDLFEKASSLRGEVTCVTKDGEHFPAIFSAATICADNGALLGVVCMAFDIRERKKMEDALRREEKKWQNTFDSISDFVSIHTTDFRLVKVNKTLADFLGKTPDELVGKRCYEVFHGTKEPWHTCPHVKTVESKEPVTEIVDDKNIGRSLLVTTSPIFDDDGEMLGSVHYAKDITELMEVKESLKESEICFKSIFDAQLTGIMLVDAETDRIVDINAAAVEMIGLPREDLIGKMRHNYIRPAESEKYSATAFGREALSDDHVLINATGKKMTILKNSAQVMITGQNYLIESFIDITDRKQEENALKEKTSLMEKFHRLTVGRELEMIRLKKEVNTLLEITKQARKYEAPAQVEIISG